MVFERFFAAPKGSSPHKGGGHGGGEEGEAERDLSRFAEDEIDAMRDQKLRELEEYRRQVQLEQLILLSRGQELLRRRSAQESL